MRASPRKPHWTLGVERWALGVALLILTAITHATPITTLVYSPDGTALLNNADRRIEIRSPKDATVLRHFACDLPKITSLAFSPNASLLAAAGGDPGVRGEVLLFSWPGAKLLHRLGGHHDLVTSIAFNADGTRLAASAADETAQFWSLGADARPAAERTLLRGHAGPVLAVAFSPSGQTVVTASADRSLKVWSTADGHLLRTFSHHTEAIHALAFRPRPKNGDAPPVACATAGDDRTVRIWQPEIGRMVRIVRQHQGPIFALAWRPDGAALFSAGKEGLIRRIDADSDTIQAQWPAHEDWIYALALSPDARTLASADWSGNVRLWPTNKTGENK